MGATADHIVDKSLRSPPGDFSFVESRMSNAAGLSSNGGTKRGRRNPPPLPLGIAGYAPSILILASLILAPRARKGRRGDSQSSLKGLSVKGLTSVK
jgi:hypothetical protein